MVDIILRGYNNRAQPLWRLPSILISYLAEQTLYRAIELPTCQFKIVPCFR
jgi:hypothetical protein